MSQLKHIKEKYGSFLLSLPNVTALGVGPKITNGVNTGQMGIKVFVVRKISSSELAANERVPVELDGAVTDVDVLGALHASNRNEPI